MPNVPIWKWCSNKPEGKCWLRPNSKNSLKKMNNWLLPYAAFSYLRDLYGTPDFSQWPEHTEYKAEEIAALCAPDSSCYEEIAFYYYTQYHYISNYLMQETMPAKKVLSLKVISLSASAATVWRHGLSRIISTWTVRQARRPTHSPWTDRTGAFPPIIGR